MFSTAQLQSYSPTLVQTLPLTVSEGKTIEEQPPFCSGELSARLV